ncbi:MAG TPA: kelch repeat-containing protein [Solirubrobacteraceae bacterium]|nr:kelch repeat-containing protein [Solirubrobacteraceae bacterium]
MGGETFHTEAARRTAGLTSLARIAGIRRQLTLAMLLATSAVSACGGSGKTTTSTTASGSTSGHAPASRARASDAAPARPMTLVYRSRYMLPAPIKDPAFAVLGAGRFALLGGLDSSEVSSASIEVGDLGGVRGSASLPLAQHDAQGAELGGKVYVFGGGSATELDHIISFDPAARVVSTVGALPQAQSDVAVAAAGGTAYVVGGYDGTNWLNTILAWRPGSPTRVAGHLPVGLRYAAASAVAGRILIIGGSTPNGASDAVYRFDPVTGRVSEIGRLPQPITHASAATLGSFVYLVGGRGNDLGSQTADVMSIDPRTGAVRRAGRLPQPLSDTASLSIGGGILVAGGLAPTSTVAGVGELVPARSS